MKTNPIRTPEPTIGNRKSAMLIVASILLTFILVVATNTFFIHFSDITYGMFKFALGVGLFVLFDKYVMVGIYTVKELKKGNNAYAIFMLAFAYLLASAFRMF